MIEVVGNLWTYPADFRVITTNGATRGDGLAVMGRGCALEAKKRYPKLARLLGERLRARGNHVQFFSDREIGDRLGLFTFPVKHRWDQPADLDLIRRSTEEFARQLLASSTYVLPRPGCGNGQRAWDEVRPIIAALPDNVRVITFEGDRAV
jgi:hypothetical protein